MEGSDRVNDHAVVLRCHVRGGELPLCLAESRREASVALQVKGQHSVGLKERDRRSAGRGRRSHERSHAHKLCGQSRHEHDKVEGADELPAGRGVGARFVVSLDIMPSSPDRENSAEIAANALTFPAGSSYSGL